MTADKFRQRALSLPEVTAQEHNGHPDFRVGNKVFATLGYPDEKWGMVALTPQQQALVIDSHPDIFQPVKGGWGQKGATNVRLAKATDGAVRDAMVFAWQNRASKTLLKQFPAP